MTSNKPLSQQIYEAGLEWADANAAAQLLEATRGSILSQMTQDIISADGPMSHAEAERRAKTSADYWEFLERMVEARKKANELKARKDYLDARMSEWQSEAANERLAAKL